jgi:hypothetical protein
LQFIGIIVASAVGKVDDLHFLHGRYHRIAELSNQFKYIANEFPVTVLFIGIGLHERHALLDDTCSYEDHEMEQLLRCTTPVDMSPFDVSTKAKRQQWRDLLLTLEQRLALAKKYPGMLADDLSHYLFWRSTGHIGSLMSLIRLGCQRAIRSGAETLTVDLLERCKVDSAVELGRRELEVAFRNGKKTTRVEDHDRSRAGHTPPWSTPIPAIPAISLLRMSGVRVVGLTASVSVLVDPGVSLLGKQFGGRNIEGVGEVEEPLVEKAALSVPPTPRPKNEYSVVPATREWCARPDRRRYDGGGLDGTGYRAQNGPRHRRQPPLLDPALRRTTAHRAAPPRRSIRVAE